MNNMKAVDLLAEARFRKRPMAALPEECRPLEPKVAYEIQRLLVKRLISNYGGQPVGYKIACTSKSARDFLKFYEPFYGRLLSPFVQGSPARLAANDFSMRVIEPEFAFRIARDLPASAAPYHIDTVATAVDAVVPAIEIVETRYMDWTKVDVPSLIADNGCNGAWVRGPSYAEWEKIDFPAHQVSLVVNGKEIRRGRGDAIMGHPFHALTWLANTLCQQGSGLKAGDLVSTGTCTEVYEAEAGDDIRVDFGAIGVVELLFEGP
jgi:2-keto-4-pentenoate hydratase